MPRGPGALPRRTFGTFSCEGKGTAGTGGAEPRVSDRQMKFCLAPPGRREEEEPNHE